MNNRGPAVVDNNQFRSEAMSAEDYAAFMELGETLGAVSGDDLQQHLSYMQPSQYRQFSFFVKSLNFILKKSFKI